MPTKRLRSVATNAAPVFAALGDARRLRLISGLCTHGPGSITALATGSGVTRQAVTKHLHVLARAGLVRAIRQGRETIYEPETERLEEAGQYLNTISRQWEQALSRLKLFVENE